MFAAPEAQFGQGLHSGFARCGVPKGNASRGQATFLLSGRGRHFLLARILRRPWEVSQHLRLPRMDVHIGLVCLLVNMDNTDVGREAGRLGGRGRAMFDSVFCQAGGLV